MPPFAQRHAISDICVLVKDLEASIAFYHDRLGFRLLHRAPGFADFSGAGLTLALWEAAHIHAHADVAVTEARPASLLIAVRLDNIAALDEAYAELTAAGVVFTAPPRDYVWNARCAYFAGPDGEIWELYAWLPGGAPGALNAGEGA